MSVECIKKGIIVIYDRNISVITKWLLRNSWLARSLFDVVDTAKGYNHESEKRQEREEKKEFNPHSQVCHTFVTISEVHNGLRDKG